MSAKEQRWPSEPALDHDYSLTLEPIRLNGPDSLDTHDIPDLEDITLEGVEVLWENDLNETETLRAADLFFDGEVHFPYGAELRKAFFQARTKNNPNPQWFTIQPPRTLAASCREILALLLRWAIKRHFSTPSAEVNLALIPLLAAVPPDGLGKQPADTSTGPDLQRTHSVPGNR